MAKPCKYRLPGQDTWMSEDDFKKSLADGLLDKFILDDKASIPSLRGFKADATSAQKFRAPVTEAKQTYSDVQKVTEDSYYDNVSNNLIEKDGKNWNVKNEVTGEVYHTAKSLKDATNWQETENQIIGRSVESKASEVTPTPVAETKTETAPKVEAETRRGVKVTYKAEESSDGKTASVQQTYDEPFGGKSEGPRFTNLPIKTDANGNRYVETKNETRVYIDKIQETAEVKEEVKVKRATVSISPSTRVTSAPNITFTKKGKNWVTTDKNGNEFPANEDQAARAEEALKEQQREERNKREKENRVKSKEETKKSISDAFDKLKIPKDRLFSIPYPVDIHNKIIELAKRLVLAGVDVASAIKQATSQVLEKRKAQKLISEAEAKKIEDYNNSKEFTDKVNEAVEGKERVSGIKKGLTSEESKELSEAGIERMTIKEALDAGESAIKNGDVVPDKLITSIIGGKNPRTGQYENGQARPLTAVETAAMVYHKASLDNELENAYNDLNKALDSKNIIDQGHAKAEIARLEEKIAEYEVMANITGYQQGLSLRLRSMMLNSEYDLVKQKAKIKAEYGGKIPADVEQKLNELDKQLREANSKLAELEKKRTKVEDEEVVKNIKETKDTEKKSAVSKDGKIKIPTSDIRQAVLNGAETIDEIVDAVRDSVKAKFPKATDRQIRDAITNYGKSRNETKDAIQKKINEMKRVGRLLSELEDVQNGIKKTKNQIKRDALTEREIELKQKIKEELAKIPLTDEEIADLQAERLERFKKTSQKAIEELKRKIDSGDFDRKKRDPLLDLDKEAADLRTKREEIKFKFDLEFEKAQRNRMSVFDKLGEQFIKALSASKSLIASLDFSAPLRQGSVFMLSQDPRKTLNQLGKQFEFWWSEKSYNKWLNGIKSSEYYPLLKASGLYIAEENAKLTAAEEAFMNNFMTKIPLIGKTKVLKSGKKLWGADIYGRAERAYTGFLNNLRVQAFLDVAEKMSEAGISPKTNIDEYKSWADYVNNATGRGTAGKKNLVGRGFEAAAPALSLGFFSPRFLWSRLNLTGINPSMYYRMSPMARKQAIKRTMGYFGAATTILGLTALALKYDDDDETSIEVDPRSSDFAKIKIGNTRIDILAGNQQVFRTIAQAYSGERKKTTTGEIEKLGEKYGSQTRGGIVGNFFVNKFSPIASTLYKKYALTKPEQEMREEEGEGGTDVKSVFLDLTIPLYLQDVKDLSKDHGAAGALGFTLLSVFGLGVQNMQPKTKSTQQSAPVMDDFEKSLYEDDSYNDFEKEERKLLEGF